MDIDLTTHVGKVIDLADPFWVASSHFTQPQMIKEWAEIKPAALTLKTCTCIDRNEPDKKSKKHKTLDLVPRYGRSFYCDGPKLEEFYTYEEMGDQLAKAKALLPSTKVGVSVLATERDKEQFSRLRSLTETEKTTADFWELNLKYSMRSEEMNEGYCNTVQQKWNQMQELIGSFLAAFKGLPVFVKLARELVWLPGAGECKEFLRVLKEHGRAGIIAANSQKLDVADFLFENREFSGDRGLSNGVLTGDVLYDGTIKLIRDLWKACYDSEIPIVASGGMVDEQQALMALRAGADAVQLCTAFEYYKPSYYRTLRSGLAARIKWRGLPNVSTFMARIREEGVATIYNMPFLYYSAFWLEDVQEEIKLDIKYSERMDAFILSGVTLLKDWEAVLRARIRNHKPVRFFLPNPDGDMFAALQKSWGLHGKQLDARKDRVSSTKQKLEQWFDEERQTVPEEDRGRLDWGVSYFENCPFYSFYLFDDKAYVAQYPFVNPSRLASPVYVFPRSSAEYDRLDKELRDIRTFIRQATAGRE